MLFKPSQKTRKKNIKTLKLKLRTTKLNSLKFNTKISLKIHISGLWFSGDYYGPYLDVMDINILEFPRKRINVYSFIENPEETDLKK